MMLLVNMVAAGLLVFILLAPWIYYQNRKYRAMRLELKESWGYIYAHRHDPLMQAAFVKVYPNWKK